MSTTYPDPAAVEAGPSRNILGIIALITAILGAIFACVPGALILGWVLLPIAFVLALVSLFLKGKKRGAGIAGLIVSVVGTVVGIIVFFAVVADAFDEAFNDETTVSTAAEEGDDAEYGDAEAGGSEVGGSDDAAAAAEEEADQEEADAAATSEDEDDEASADDAEPGTRANPYPLGSEISTSDWAVTVNGVDLDATDAVLAENPYNEDPEEGHTYILVDLSVQYTGDDPEGDTPWVSVDYVSPAGNTFRSSDRVTVTPDSFDSMSTLYEGASTTGNVALHVPADGVEDGVLTVSPGMFADDVFVAVD
ncbi:hypothetical protein [Nesterenkonia sp. PF2B19]|uniref:hypothetical protein n=1 Tax=Nesterenkonia sp. PF2B19 TaxID=1881858 RepID=UPI00087207DC|nr:hypothetical protein [Nesterenkonia sp. PF2B19]OSM44620.1 hypothetical protein BCY76_001645 [Nesterenkonia sp. PF2B19]